jgi:hypothetical protein
MNLYHYRNLNERLIQYLRDRRMYFQSPLLFNDPFDFDLECLRIEDSGRTREQLDAYKGYLLVQIHRTQKARDRMANRIRDRAGDPHDEQLPLPVPAIEIAYREHSFFAEELRNLESDPSDASIKLGSSWARLRLKLATNLGVLCFSECPTQILMWSHYANSHKGVCLEFDSKQLPIKGWKKYSYHRVKYVTQRTIDVISTGYTEATLQLLTCKSTDWAYEQERRLVTIKGPGFQDTRISAITAITLGAKIRENPIELRTSLLSAIRQHQADRRSVRPIELRVAEKVSGEFSLAVRTLANVNQLVSWLGVEIGEMRSRS